MKILFTLLAGLLFCKILAAQDGKKADETISTGNKIKFSSLIQIWNTTNFENNDLENKTFNTFRIRRVETKFTGIVNDNVAFTAMFDFAKILKSSSTQPDTNGVVDKADSKQSAYAILQDVYITYYLNKKNKVELQIGQFKYPLTYEGLQSSSGLDFIERSELVRAFGDKRDIGLQLSAKPGKMVEAALMLVQGNSQNKTDANTKKDIAGRIIVKPLNGFSVGGSIYQGHTGNDGKTPQNRLAAEAVYKNKRITTYHELILAKDSETGPAKSQKAAYLVFLYTLDDHWQPGIRYEHAWKNFEEVKKVPRSRVTYAVNYFIDKNAKVQLNYVFGKYSKGHGGTVTNSVFVNWQVNF